MNTATFTAKDYLCQAYRIDLRINSRLEQIQSLRSLTVKASAILSDTPEVKGTRNIHGLEDVVIKMLELESAIGADMQELIDLKREIETVVSCVEPPELRTLLELRYFCYKTWEEIAVELHYDLRHVHRLHGRALSEVDSIRRHGCH
jgi:hypothetical protein